MKTIDEYAAEAKRAIGRWYGTRMYFAAPKSVAPPFEDFIKAHWQRFAWTDPTGRGPIIDGKAVDVTTPRPLPRPSGDVCQDCGSFAMVRTGVCLTCQSCGSSSGGCS